MTEDRPFVGARLSVELQMHEGRRFEIVRSPAVSVVVARTPGNDVLLVEQFRPAVGVSLVELPAGLVDPGESPVDAAARELLEETGYRANDLAPLGDGFFATAGMSDERYHLFTTPTDSEAVGTPDGEVSRIILMPWGEALDRARAGGFEDAKTSIGLLLAGAEE